MREKGHLSEYEEFPDSCCSNPRSQTRAGAHTSFLLQRVPQIFFHSICSIHHLDSSRQFLIPIFTMYSPTCSFENNLHPVRTLESRSRVTAYLKLTEMLMLWPRLSPWRARDIRVLSYLMNEVLDQPSWSCKRRVSVPSDLDVLHS